MSGCYVLHFVHFTVVGDVGNSPCAPDKRTVGTENERLMTDAAAAAHGPSHFYDGCLKSNNSCSPLSSGCGACCIICAMSARPVL